MIYGIHHERIRILREDAFCIFHCQILCYLACSNRVRLLEINGVVAAMRVRVCARPGKRPSYLVSKAEVNIFRCFWMARTVMEGFWNAVLNEPLVLCGKISSRSLAIDSSFKHYMKGFVFWTFIFAPFWVFSDTSKMDTRSLMPSFASNKVRR